MRVAALYDIHGNLPALEAVLQTIPQAEVDLIVVGGDVLPGPMPGETLACLLNLPVPVQFIQGNGEVAVLAAMAGQDPPGVSQQFHGLIRWVAEQLSPEYARVLANWPKTLRVGVAGLGEVLFCHATPRSDTEVFTCRTPEDRLTPIFEGVPAPLVICGHTHMQFDRRLGTTRVVNAGSVGMPYGEPGAYWLMLGPDVVLRHTRYNLREAAERVRATPYPDAENFAAHSILQPSSEKEMRDLFTRLSLK